MSVPFIIYNEYGEPVINSERLKTCFLCKKYFANDNLRRVCGPTEERDFNVCLECYKTLSRPGWNEVPQLGPPRRPAARPHQREPVLAKEIAKIKPIPKLTMEDLLARL